jgi:hypothetical protein
MAMTPQACVDAMATLLATVSGVGKVYKYRRIVRSEQAIRDLLCPTATPGKVNCWMISPAGANTTVTERNPGHHGIGVKGGGNVLTTFQFQVEGYYQLDDENASEETFRNLSWAVADEFNSYGALNIAGIAHQLPADVEQFGFVFLAGLMLLHYARIGVGFRGRTRP